MFNILAFAIQDISELLKLQIQTANTIFMFVKIKNPEHIPDYSSFPRGDVLQKACAMMCADSEFIAVFEVCLPYVITVDSEKLCDEPYISRFQKVEVKAVLDFRLFEDLNTFPYCCKVCFCPIPKVFKWEFGENLAECDLSSA